MGDENPIRALGDYSKPSHEGYRNTIKLPIGNNVVPLRPDTIRLVQNGCSFHGLRSEDPNQYLKDFHKLVDSLDLDGANRERTRMRYYLMGKKLGDLMWFSLGDLEDDLTSYSMFSSPLLSGKPWGSRKPAFVCIAVDTSRETRVRRKDTIGAAYEALGLLGDDREWETALEEACVFATSEQLRFVFSHILLHCDVANPYKLWTKYWEQMSQYIPKKVSEKVQIPNYHLNTDSLQGYTLYELEIILNNCGNSLQSFSLPPPPSDLLEQLANRLLMEDRNYNREELIQLKNYSVPRLNAD
ncbi:hypothetical protein Tco_0241172 [Tanacetum coccineum]